MCKCPVWAHDCNFASSPNIDNFLNKTTLRNILYSSTPPYCSLNKTIMCPIAKIANFNIIMLYDNSTHFVNDLNLVHLDAFNKEDFICLGEVNLSIGTSYYCRFHNCANYFEINSTLNPVKFCYYDPQGLTFFVSSENERIPIKAWGRIKQTYYEQGDEQKIYDQILEEKAIRKKRSKRSVELGTKSPLSTKNKSTILTEINMECEKGGIIINSIKNLSIILACSDSYCVNISRPSHKQTIIFPEELTVKNYHVNVKFFNLDKMIDEKNINCNASPICEMITCRFCLEYIQNPQCVDQLHWALLIAIIILMLHIATLSIKIIKFVFMLIYFLIIPLKNCIKLRKKKKTKNFKSKKYVLLIISIILNFKTVIACDEITNLVAGTNDCSTNKDGKLSCTFDQTTQISVKPEHITCLKLEDKNRNVTMGTIKINVSVQIVCAEKSDYFTRNYQIKSVSTKRCPTQGSCTGDRCQKLKMTDRNPEIRDFYNNKPGYTYCIPSCGGWHCGCFIASDGCLFYRTYAEANTVDLFEIINCPSWTIELNVDMIREQKENNSSKSDKSKISTVLYPGILNKVEPNTAMTLISTTIPPTPLFGSKFIINRTKNKTVLVDNEHLLEKSLRCSTASKAKKFQCTYPPESCQCHGGDSKAHCECGKDPISEMFSNKEYILPKNSKGSYIYFDDKIKAHLQYTTALQLQITLKNYNMKATYDKSNCTITTKSLEGCYSCDNGAKWLFNCTIDFGTALASISCPSQTIHVNYNNNETMQSIQLHYDKELIEEKCQINCPGGKSEILLKAKLKYIEQQNEKIENTLNLGEDSINGTSSVWNDLTNFLGSVGNFFTSIVKNNLYNLLVILPIVIITIFLILFLFPVIYPMFIRCILSICNTRTKKHRGGSVASANHNTKYNKYKNEQKRKYIKKL